MFQLTHPLFESLTKPTNLSHGAAATFITYEEFSYQSSEGSYGNLQLQASMQQDKWRMLTSSNVNTFHKLHTEGLLKESDVYSPRENSGL